MNGLNTTVLDYDTALKSIPWGDGVTYASVHRQAFVMLKDAVG